MKNKISYSLLIVIALLIGGSCTNKNSKKGKSKNIKKVPIVSVQKVKRQSLSSSIVVVGTIKPNSTATVKSPEDGIVDKLNARETQYVKKGEIVAVINPSVRISLIAKNKQKLI